MTDAHSILVWHIALTIGIFITLALVVFLLIQNKHIQSKREADRLAAIERLSRRTEVIAKEVAETLDQRLTSLDAGQEVIKHELGADQVKTPTTRQKIDEIDKKTEILLTEHKGGDEK